MNQIDAAKCSLYGLEEDDELIRADIVIENAISMGCHDVISPEDFVKAQRNLNTMFLTELFITNNGL